MLMIVAQIRGTRFGSVSNGWHTAPFGSDGSVPTDLNMILIWMSYVFQIDVNLIFHLVLHDFECRDVYNYECRDLYVYECRSYNATRVAVVAVRT